MLRKHMNQTADKMACSATRRGPNSTAFTKRTSSTKVGLRNVWYVYCMCIYIDILLVILAHTCNLRWAAIGCNRLWNSGLLWNVFWWVLGECWRDLKGLLKGLFCQAALHHQQTVQFCHWSCLPQCLGGIWLEMGPTPRHQPINVVDPINDPQLIFVVGYTPIWDDAKWSPIGRLMGLMG